MHKYLYIFFLFCILIGVASCSEEKALQHPYAGLTKEYFDSLSEDGFKTNSKTIRENILKMVHQDSDSLAADRYTRLHYRRTSNAPSAFLWINRTGVSRQADTLLACLDSCELDGFVRKQFRVDEIAEDLSRVRNVDYEMDGRNSVNRVLARLEYNLTKAFLRYGVGQRYGFVNPKELFNRLDVRDSDSLHCTYRQLFDIKIHISGKQTFSRAISCIRHDSVGYYLSLAMNHSNMYNRIKAGLKDGRFDKQKVMINLERARWRATDAPESHNEYVIVNIPSFHLWAMRDGKVAHCLKIGCGAWDTKTPLLYSEIKRMDINPQWIIPGSIRVKDMVRHAGNAAYFDNNHYFAIHKATGKKVTGAAISYTIINSPEWAIVQAGGEGNSLGRIIFRFDNNFSIYLHDTDSRGVFTRDNRSVSHGCIRVDKPYDLACFMLRDKDSETAEKIKYSMETDISEENPNCDRKKLIRSKEVNPRIPLFIIYYTIYPVPGGALQKYPDIYAYDQVIAKAMKAI